MLSTLRQDNETGRDITAYIDVFQVAMGKHIDKEIDFAGQGWAGIDRSTYLPITKERKQPLPLLDSFPGIPDAIRSTYATSVTVFSIN